jgi:hypothetical protein
MRPACTEIQALRPIWLPSSSFHRVKDIVSSSTLDRRTMGLAKAAYVHHSIISSLFVDRRKDSSYIFGQVFPLKDDASLFTSLVQTSPDLLRFLIGNLVSWLVR